MLVGICMMGGERETEHLSARAESRGQHARSPQLQVHTGLQWSRCDCPSAPWEPGEEGEDAQKRTGTERTGGSVGIKRGGGAGEGGF